MHSEAGQAWKRIWSMKKSTWQMSHVEIFMSVFKRMNLNCQWTAACLATSSTCGFRFQVCCSVAFKTSQKKLQLSPQCLINTTMNEEFKKTHTYDCKRVNTKKFEPFWLCKKANKKRLMTLTRASVNRSCMRFRFRQIKTQTDWKYLTIH